MATDSEIVFTPAAILDLLSKIDEFKDFDLSLTESLDGDLILQVGDSIYSLTSEDSTSEIEVDDEVVDELENINEETYSELMDNGFATDEETIETGIIKEALKTLLIGGVVRLGKHYLTH